jgi:hypothetical protein
MLSAATLASTERSVSVSLLPSTRRSYVHASYSSFLCTYVCIYVCAYICVYISVCLYMCVYICCVDMREGGQRLLAAQHTPLLYACIV